MSNPIDEYAEALELHKKDRQLSAEKLARSIGGDKATEPILSSLDKIFDKETTLHKVVLHAVTSESLKRERLEKNVRR